MHKMDAANLFDDRDLQILLPSSTCWGVCFVRITASRHWRGTA